MTIMFEGSGLVRWMDVGQKREGGNVVRVRHAAGTLKARAHWRRAVPPGPEAAVPYASTTAICGSRPRVKPLPPSC